MLLPCNVKKSLIVGGVNEKISDNCNKNEEELWNYLGPPTLWLFSNTGRFEVNQYGEEPV